jgi:hypothetical protein
VVVLAGLHAALAGFGNWLAKHNAVKADGTKVYQLKYNNVTCYKSGSPFV